MDNIIYYPYINLPPKNWTIRTLLYYDTVSSIVPQQFFNAPDENYEPFMLELVRNNLVIPVDPMQALNKYWELRDPFLSFVHNKDFNLKKKAKKFRKNPTAGTSIYGEKFAYEIFYELQHLDLAKREDGNMYLVETTTAEYLMNYLASIIGIKLNLQPVTNKFSTIAPREKENEFEKKKKILKDLIPYPEGIDLKKLMKFKDKHRDLLKSFRNRVEGVVFDETSLPASKKFENQVEELIIRKNELAAKMREGKFKQIFLGSICGVAGSIPGLADANTPLAIAGGIAAFVSSVYTAVHLDTPEKQIDQSGMKYIALLDRRLRK